MPYYRKKPIVIADLKQHLERFNLINSEERLTFEPEPVSLMFANYADCWALDDGAADRIHVKTLAWRNV